MNDKNVPVLDSLRAVAALSVCFFHFVITVTGFINSNVVRSVFSFGHYGVQMFFVISGFIIPWSLYHSSYQIKNYFTFIVKRLIRLEPPYLISLFIAIAITFLRPMNPYFNAVDMTPSKKQILLHFGYLIPFFKNYTWIRPVYWTLAIEFQYYLSIGLLFPLIANKKMGLRILCYVLFLLGPVFFNRFLPFHLPVFLFGVILFLYKSGIILKLEFHIVTFLASLALLFYHDWGALAFSFFTFLAILYFEDFKNSILTFFGKISYSIYLFHSLTGMIILNYFTHWVLNPYYRIIVIVFSLTVTFALSYLVYRFIEVPSKRLSSKIKFKK